MASGKRYRCKCCGNELKNCKVYDGDYGIAPAIEIVDHYTALYTCIECDFFVEEDNIPCFNDIEELT